MNFDANLSGIPVDLSELAIRLHWCENEQCGIPYEREYVQQEGHETGHYHVALFQEAVRWYVQRQGLTAKKRCS